MAVEPTASRVIENEGWKQANKIGFVILILFIHYCDGTVFAFILHVYRSGSLDPKTYPFKIPEDTEEKKDILIGLTGEDWPSKKTRLIAWKLELRSSDQRILAQKQSFLWEHEK